MGSDSCPLAPIRRSAEPQTLSRDLGPLGVLSRAFSSCGLWMIWSLEAANFLVHVALRPSPWNAVSTVTGYVLWALQLASLASPQPTLERAAAAVSATRGRRAQRRCSAQ